MISYLIVYDYYLLASNLNSLSPVSSLQAQVRRSRVNFEPFSGVGGEELSKKKILTIFRKLGLDEFDIFFSKIVNLVAGIIARSDLPSGE